MVRRDVPIVAEESDSISLALCCAEAAIGHTVAKSANKDPTKYVNVFFIGMRVAGVI